MTGPTSGRDLRIARVLDSHWFGESWNPAIWSPAEECAVPVGAPCNRCEKPIGERDSGAIYLVLAVPAGATDADLLAGIVTEVRAGNVAYHVACWRAMRSNPCRVHGLIGCDGRGHGASPN